MRVVHKNYSLRACRVSTLIKHGGIYAYIRQHVRELHPHKALRGPHQERERRPERAAPRAEPFLDQRQRRPYVVLAVRGGQSTLVIQQRHAFPEVLIDIVYLAHAQMNFALNLAEHPGKRRPQRSICRGQKEAVNQNDRSGGRVDGADFRLGRPRQAVAQRAERLDILRVGARSPEQIRQDHAEPRAQLGGMTPDRPDDCLPESFGHCEKCR